MPRARPLFAAVAAVTVATAAGGFDARAQLPILPSSTTSTSSPPPEPTTTAPPGTTTTTAAPTPTPTIEPTVPGTPTSTTTPAPGPVPEVPPASAPSQPPVGGDSAKPPVGALPAIPPEAEALMRSVRRTGPNSTRKLLEALRPLQDLGVPEREVVQVAFGRFPVGGPATYSHDWLFPRFTPFFHLHEGTDIFAAFGTPVRAPADGTLKQSEGAVGGLAAYVYEPNGTYYYMSHLQGFVPGQRSGQRVKVGDTVGYVGDSGNARGGTPHLHFEIHPAPTRTVTTGKGKDRRTTLVTRPVPVGTVLPPVDPKPHLDQWLKDALVNVPRVIGSMEAARPRALVATGITRRLADGRAGIFGAPAGPPRVQLLWASSASPSGGALRLAEAEAAAAAGEFDWLALARRRQAQLEAQLLAESRSKALLTPITPVALRPTLGLS